MGIEYVSSQGKKILFIDDNITNLKLVGQIVATQTSYEFISATDALKGLVLAEEQQPDLILMDINMPQMDGFDALLVLQNNKAIRHIPVIAVSGNAMLNDIQKGQAAGFVDYITKPFNIKMMIDIINKMLA